MISPGRKRALAAVAVALAAVGGASCRSLPKDEVEERLLALPKNAGLRAIGLEHRTMTVRLPGADGARDVEAVVTVLHAPCRSATPRSGAPVVLVHGTPGSLFTWTDVILGNDGSRGLCQDFEVYAIDVVGHGTTRTEVRPVTFQICADWVAAAIRALGAGPVHLVGNSYGGEFCWRTAADHPELVRSLALLDASGWTRPAGGWLPEETAMREMSLAPYGWMFSTRDKVRGALQPHFPFTVSDDQVEECFTLCANADDWKSMVELARDENGARSADLARVAAPTLLLWGADDIAFPPARDAGRFAATIPDAELHVLERCGHYPQETRPAEVTELLRTFLGAHR